MLLCTRARLMKSLACAAASESIVDWRVKNENMQRKALNPQPQNVSCLTGGAANNAGPPVASAASHFHWRKTGMESFAGRG